VAFSRTSLVEYLSVNYGIPREELQDDLPLFSSQLLDSFNLVDLVAFIETETKLKFGVLDLTLDNLDTVSRILAYVQRRIGVR